MKSKLITISTRMDQENLDYVQKVSKMFDLDRSTAIRMLFKKGIQEDKKEKALNMYFEGKFSLETAARFCDLYMGEFLELLKTKGIELNLTLEDYKEGLSNIKKVWKNR